MSDTTTPYFPRNRDETDVAYQRGWDDAELFRTVPVPYQKQLLVKAYQAGFAARFVKDFPQ